MNIRFATLKTQSTHIIAHGVLLKVNPDRPNIHRMRAESRPELRDLRRIALARIPGAIAREPVRVDVRDPRRARVVVRRHEVRVDLAPDAACLLEPADDCFGEALAQRFGVCRGGDERGGVDCGHECVGGGCKEREERELLDEVEHGWLVSGCGSGS